MAFAICGTETVTIKTVVLLWKGLAFALMFHFSISTNIVNKKGYFRNKVLVFSPNHSYKYSCYSQKLTTIIACSLVA